MLIKCMITLSRSLTGQISSSGRLPPSHIETHPGSGSAACCPWIYNKNSLNTVADFFTEWMAQLDIVKWFYSGELTDNKTTKNICSTWVPGKQRLHLLFTLSLTGNVGIGSDRRSRPTQKVFVWSKTMLRRTQRSAVWCSQDEWFSRKLQAAIPEAKQWTCSEQARFDPARH